MTNWMASKHIALVGVDIQNDFCANGNLAVPDGDDVVPLFNSLRDHFHIVVLTQDFHPAGHSSFASTHGRAIPDPDTGGFPSMKMSYGEQTLWPDHCVQGTKGADFHPDLVQKSTDLVLQKGTNQAIDSYSGFFENDGKTQPRFAGGETLTETMRGKGVDTLVFTGLASDFCVGWHALDAIKEGFNAVVIYDATKPIAIPLDNGKTTETEMLRQMKDAGVKVINAAEAKLLLAA